MSKEGLGEILKKFERCLEWKHQVVMTISTADKVEFPGIDYLDIDQAHSAILAWFREEVEGLKKEKIDITKKMCHNLEYPTDCLYDKPNENGATCVMQDKNIPKEKCNDYKDMQVEYEDFAQYNQAISDILAKLEG